MRKKGLSILFCSFLLITSAQQPHRLRLWYDEPASYAAMDTSDGWINDAEWLKALPLGNGSLGAMVFGDVNKERIQLNEKSLWSGSPDDNDKPDAYASLQKIRELLWEGKYTEAGVLTEQTQVCKGAGSGQGNGTLVPFGSFQTLGDLWIETDEATSYDHYQRELDLETAVAKTTWEQNGVQFEREAFISFPDQLMVIRIKRSDKKTLKIRCTLTRPERFKTVTAGDQLLMQGTLPDGKGGDGMKYAVRLKVVYADGEIKASGSTLTITQPGEIVLLLAAATDYRLHYPDYKGDDPLLTTREILDKVDFIPYTELLRRHLADFRALSARVELDLCGMQPDTVPTDVRLEQYKINPSDRHLEELAFHYGRYLLISSSRPGSLPANLQGIWSNKIQTPWNGDYHTNINIQMNYWPVEVTNLPECFEPFTSLVSSLTGPGSKTAAVQYHAKGWCVHPITNVWGYTAPGEHASWGLHPVAGAWLCQHLFEHYSFTMDTAYLKKVYPVMQGSALFYLDWLVKDPVSGKLVSGPANSPENSFIAPDGSNSQISMGPAHDQQVIRDLFENLIQASQILNLQDSVAGKVEKALGELDGPRIGSDGRLMEWAREFEEAEPGHRHMSHLFGLHPGDQFSWSKTPALMKAVQKSLEYRISHGGGHTGWSAAWIVSFRARLREGDNAHDMIETLLKKCSAPNLFGMHPPFQIDGNFGLTAGIAEMLVQSHEGFIDLLPALPKVWQEGEVKGLRARGGFVIDISWKYGRPDKIRLFSGKGGLCTLRYDFKELHVETEAGKSYEFSGMQFTTTYPAPRE